MKRTGAITILALIIIIMTTGIGFAAEKTLTLDKTYPEDGATGTSIDNLSIKLYFNEDVSPKKTAVKTANEKAINLVDNKGNSIPLLIKYTPDKDKIGQVLVVADASRTNSSQHKATIKNKTRYTLTIDKSFTAANGARLGDEKKISFTTVDQNQSSKVQFALMGLTIIVMVVATSRATKKQMKKEEEEKKKGKNRQTTVNPYKEAKRTGKTIEEIVEKDKRNKAKEQAKAAAAAKKKEERERKLREKYGIKVNELSSETKKVSGPRPISAAGIDYKAPIKKTVGSASSTENNPNRSSKQKSTKPKNQTDKQKNSKSKNKKKK